MHSVHEDINFSSPDNYWCTVYERAVKQYVKKSHNCKGIEATFAQSESRREFLKPLQVADQTKDGKVDLVMMSVRSSINRGIRGTLLILLLCYLTCILNVFLFG